MADPEDINLGEVSPPPPPKKSRARRRTPQDEAAAAAAAAYDRLNWGDGELEIVKRVRDTTKHVPPPETE